MSRGLMGRLLKRRFGGAAAAIDQPLQDLAPVDQGGAAQRVGLQHGDGSAGMRAAQRMNFSDIFFAMPGPV